jgi:ubiquinone biosynthesis protein
MREQVGFKGLLRTLRKEAPYWATMLPQMPRLLHRALADDRIEHLEQRLGELVTQQRRRNRILAVAVAVLALALAWAAFLTVL